MLEMWKFLVGRFAGFKYEVSDCGRIRSGQSSWRNGRILRPFKDKWGYRRVNLSSEGQTVQVPVHRLVAEAFIGVLDGMEVNHKDGNKENNHATNLEWVTNEENNQHATEL